MSLRFIMSFLSVLFHSVFLKLKVFGNNKLEIGMGVILWKSKIRTEGHGNTILLRENVNFKRTNILIKGNNNRIVISNSVKIYESCEILIEGDNCHIFIGKKTTLGSGSIFCGESNTSIQIGENCMLSREVFMNTSDFHSIIDLQSNARINRPQNIKINNHVWIGFNARINKGALIGENSIVATGAIVAGKTYPPNVILAGIPARILKEGVTWSKEKLPF